MEMQILKLPFVVGFLENMQGKNTSVIFLH